MGSVIMNISRYIESFSREMKNSTSDFDFELEEQRKSLDKVIKILSKIKPEWRVLSDISYEQTPDETIRILNSTKLTECEIKHIGSILTVDF